MANKKIEKKSEKRPEKIKPIFVDKYSSLKEELKKIADQGLESYQETTEGRVIDYMGLRLMSKHGIFVKTGDNGNIEILLSGSEKDPKTEKSDIQRLEMGLNIEVSTKSKVTTTTDLKKRKNIMAKNFEIISAAYDATAKSIEQAQKKGTEIQKEIDEEDKNWWEFLHQKGIKSTISLDDGEELNINNIVQLVTTARQEVTNKLGAKLEDVYILFFKLTDSFIFADTDGSLVDSTVPRVGLVIQVNTKDGNTAFGAIRGVGNLEVLRRYTLHSEEEKSNLEIVSELARKVSDQAIALDRAQNTSILGSEVPVIMSCEVVGVFIHEILGHPSEADIIIANKKDKLAEINLKSRVGGTVIENTDFNMIDVGESNFDLGKYQVKSAFGSVPFDNHGTTVKKTEIVTKGVFTNPLTDRYTLNEVTDGLNDDIRLKILEHSLSGNSRTPDYKHSTQVRMTNTYLLPNESGPKSVEEMAKKIPKNKKGVYLESSSGGWVNTETGEFCIKGNLGYLIENGTITDKPIKNITFMGNINKIGNNIKEIGSSATIKNTFSGFCGKSSRDDSDSDTAWVPVDGAGPAIYIDEANIGSINTLKWMKICREYMKQSSEINEGYRKKGSFHIKEVEDISSNSVNQEHLCMLAQYAVEDELKILLGGMKSITTFTLTDDGKLNCVNENF